MAIKRKSQPANDLDNIRQDLDSLKSNVIELAKDLKASGARSTKEAKETLYANANRMKEASKDQYHNIENNVRANPTKSVGIAFAAGVLASFLFSQSRK